MLFPSVSDSRIIEEARRYTARFDAIVDEAFKTLPIQPRIEQARRRLNLVSVGALTIRTALQQRGKTKEAEEFTRSYHGALMAADLYNN